MIDVPAFTVIVPTYRRPDLLRRSISSVLSQGWRNFELVVVDDASGDESREVATGFADPRVRYLCHEENRGVAAARNTGIAASKARFISLLDDDDEYDPNFLAETHRAFSAAPQEVGLVWCGVRWIRDLHNGRQEIVREEVWQPSYSDRESAYLEFLESRRVGTNCGLTFRRRVFDRIGGFDEQFPGGAEDTDLLIRVVREFDFRVIPTPLIRVHLHGNEHLRLAGLARAKGYDRIIEKHRDTLERNSKLWASVHYKAGWLHYHSGDRKRGRERLRQALARYPLHHQSWLALLLFETMGHRAPAIHRRLSSLRKRQRPLL